MRICSLKVLTTTEPKKQQHQQRIKFVIKKRKKKQPNRTTTPTTTVIMFKSFSHYSNHQHSAGVGGGGGGGGGANTSGGLEAAFSLKFDRHQYRTANNKGNNNNANPRYANSRPIKIKKHHHNNGASRQHFASGGNREGELTINLTRNEPRVVVANAAAAGHHYHHNHNHQFHLNQQLAAVNSNIGQLSLGQQAQYHQHNHQQQHQQQHQHHQKYPHSRYKFFNHFNNTKKQLSAPYNTTQYIMYDYSKRHSKDSKLRNAGLCEQFAQDWNMALATTDSETAAASLVTINLSSNHPNQTINAPHTSLPHASSSSTSILSKSCPESNCLTGETSSLSSTAAETATQQFSMSI